MANHLLESVTGGFMSEHERTITVGAPPENAFRYLSSISNLPAFVPHLRDLQEDENGHLWGFADFEGRRSEISGFFRADGANCRLDWESDGTPGYRGWLQIAPAGKNQSRVTVHLSMESAAAEIPPPHPGLASDRIERELDNVLSRMREALEREAAVNA
jgi:uncharacterized membrane protein